MKLTEIKRENLRKVIKEFFKKDPYYIDKLHIMAGKGLEACVDFNVEQIETLKFRAWRWADIGFFAIVEEPLSLNLNLFFVSPEHRDGDKKDKLLEAAVKKTEGKGCCTWVPKKNEKINRFYKKHGRYVGDFTAYGQDTVMYFLGGGNSAWQ